MLSPRWRKVLRDLWGNRTRTLLVVLSIAVGVFAIALVLGSRAIMVRELAAAYAAINPAQAQISTEPFDDSLVQELRHIPGVRDVQGLVKLNLRVKTGPDAWQQLTLIAYPDYNAIRINKMRSERGAWPPPANQLVIERSSLELLNADIGDTVVVELPSGTQYELPIAGTAYDLNLPPTQLSGQIFSFVAVETIEWLGRDPRPTELNLVFDNQPSTVQDAEAATRPVRDRIEQSGRKVLDVVIPTPGQSPADEALTPLLLLLGVLGILALCASGFLVVNTISALLMQQIRQIGVMKAIGARTRQIAVLYMATALLLGIMALIIAVPLGAVGAQLFARFIAGLVNTDLVNERIPPGVLLAEIAVGLLVPLLAALWPVLAGTRITIREAITSYGLSEEKKSTGKRPRGSRFAFSRPLLLSLRNTFRRRGRLALTLTTLTLSGLIFISILSLRSSLVLSLDEALKYFNYDIGVVFDRSHPVEQIEQIARSVPGVEIVESWGFGTVRRERQDGSESKSLVLFAPHAETQMLKPTLLEGRWLQPNDQNALVVNATVLETEPDITTGAAITLRIDGRTTEWQVVGIVGGAGDGAIVYANYPYYDQVARLAGGASSVQITATQHDAATTAQLAKTLERTFEAGGMRVVRTQTLTRVREQNTFAFNIVISFLLIMAFLMAIIGGLGLMGTMGINVIERTREIGVMRALGASNRAVRRVVLSEGVLIGVLSWLLAAIFALPFSKLLSDTVGSLIFHMTMSYSFSLTGAVIWLALVVIVAALASILPARRAARLTVREVLAYEG